MSKKILIIGNGGREHAIADALARSPQETELYNFGTAVNPGINNLCKKVYTGNILDMDEVLHVAREVRPDLAIVGPDDPIGEGAADVLRSLKILTFAPSRRGAQLEASKSFTRDLLKKYEIDASPEFYISTEINDEGNRKAFYDNFAGEIVVKADGLCGGKGVLVSGDHFEDFQTAENFAKQSIEKFGRVVFEEKLIGEEFSLMSIVDGETVLDTPAIQDHKRAFEGDTGPNTGGMGCISDANLSLPFVTQKDLDEAHEITVKTMKAINQELGERYIGVMYGGFIITKRGVKLIEYNARFGDPEALNLFPILKSDFVDVVEKAAQGRLDEVGTLEFERKATVVKYLCPNGYPTDPVKNESIMITDSIDNIEADRGKVYFASVGEEDGQIILKGSRAIGICGTGNSLEEAHANAEVMVSYFEGPLFYRKDIGTRELVQQRIDHMNRIRGIEEA